MLLDASTNLAWATALGGPAATLGAAALGFFLLRRYNDAALKAKDAQIDVLKTSQESELKGKDGQIEQLKIGSENQLKAKDAQIEQLKTANETILKEKDSTIEQLKGRLELTSAKNAEEQIQAAEKLNERQIAALKSQIHETEARLSALQHDRSASEAKRGAVELQGAELREQLALLEKVATSKGSPTASPWVSPVFWQFPLGEKVYSFGAAASEVERYKKIVGLLGRCRFACHARWSAARGLKATQSKISQLGIDETEWPPKLRAELQSAQERQAETKRVWDEVRSHTIEQQAISDVLESSQFSIIFTGRVGSPIVPVSRLIASVLEPAEKEDQSEDEEAAFDKVVDHAVGVISDYLAAIVKPMRLPSRIKGTSAEKA